MTLRIPGEHRNLTSSEIIKEKSIFPGNLKKANGNWKNFTQTKSSIAGAPSHAMRPVLDGDRGSSQWM